MAARRARALGAIPWILGGIIVAAACPSQAGDYFAGREIYDEQCARCHGTDGFPVIAGVPDFTRGEGLMAPDATLFVAIKNGQNLMPAFNGILREEDILNVIAYTRSLQR